MKGINPKTSGKTVLTVTMVVAVAAFLVACTAKWTTQTPRGALELMLEALKSRDAAKMKTFCKAGAVDQCDRLLAVVAEMEKTGKASKFDSWNTRAGDVPSGSRANAYADLFGLSHDLFLRVNVTFERDDKGRWKIDQMLWESKRQE